MTLHTLSRLRYDTSMNFLVHELYPTQNSLRDFNLVIDFVLQYDSIHDKCISVMETEDGKLWIRDGHHRCTAIWIVNGNIPKKYVKIEKFTYKEINEYNIYNRWYTPFNPIKECRKADTSNFKSIIKYYYSLYSDVKRRNSTIEWLIKNQPTQYKEKRKVLTIEDVFLRTKASNQA